MSKSTNPFLMFSGSNHGKAEEAANFYAKTFKNAEINEMSYFQEGEGQPVGTVKSARVRLNQVELRLMDSDGPHQFNFTPSISFFIECESDNEITDLANILSEKGQFMMPLGNYGFSEKFAWVQDRYGVSWQLNLSN